MDLFWQKQILHLSEGKLEVAIGEHTQSLFDFTQ